MTRLENKESPFTPGKPVPVEYFVAREKEIDRLDRTIRQASSGRNENIFITGERGIGKSSLARFFRYKAEKEYGFVGTHCFLGGIRDLEGMIRMIFQRLLQEVTDKNIFDKLKDFFGKYIKGFTLFGVGVEFTDDRTELRSLLDNFLPVLRKINETMKSDNKNGIILILDDLNGITGVSDFSHFIKSTVDELATSKNYIPLLLILVGTQERQEDLIKYQPSVARIFDIIDLTTMNKEESKEFFITAFKKQNIDISESAIDLMIRFSGGFPMLMHEVGDAVFYEDIDNKIDRKDALFGIHIAADIVGRKYLDPQVYSALRSKTYRSILRKMGSLPIGNSFHRKDIIPQMRENEQKNLDNFIRKIKKLGIIREEEVRGEYSFINQLYHLYIKIEALRSETTKPNKKS